MSFFPKIDDVDRNVVLFHLFGKSDEILRGVFKRRGNEDYDALFLQFILSMLESQLDINLKLQRAEHT